MRKSIFFSLLCLIAIVAVACGGGNNAGGTGNDGGAACGDGGNGGGAADAYALYKKEGRSWLLKNEMEVAGNKMVTFTKTEVTKVADDHAMIKTTSLKEDKTEQAPGTETKIEFATAEATDTSGEAAPEPTKETVKVEAGEFECYVTENAGTKVWSSVEYPGLTVKMEGATMKSELVEFNK